ncbi:hypothetical protein G7075_18270 [Phycicoccus sp. HDW14]|uniref:hypothetical protein n=1 Tax=Phycicoccus sp. HDW14 TaxID=2714941 RepID=UPI0014074904|nr:hypothetical protein [Phycicoccus sp. HDW14]QIM22628.1 hypothetical protein G7075_18270 [Phycicoccus sp. HDW14]
MSSEATSAVIAAFVALVVAGGSAVVTVRAARRQRTLDLLVSSLDHMTGGTQQRGAGFAALTAIRATATPSEWRGLEPAIAGHVQRQLVYLLRHDRKRRWHEVENMLVMAEALRGSTLGEHLRPNEWGRLDAAAAVWLDRPGAGLPPGAMNAVEALRDDAGRRSLG